MFSVTISWQKVHANGPLAFPSLPSRRLWWPTSGSAHHIPAFLNWWWKCKLGQHCLTWCAKCACHILTMLPWYLCLTNERYKTAPDVLGSLKKNGWLVGRLVGWLVGWVGGWLVGWLVGRLVGWLVGWVVGWLVGWCLYWRGQTLAWVKTEVRFLSY